MIKTPIMFQSELNVTADAIIKNKICICLDGFNLSRIVVSDKPIVNVNNILFTLTIGLSLTTILDKLKPSKQMQILFLIIASAVTFNSDWNIIGVLIIYFFYKDSKIEPKTLIIIASTTAIMNFIATLDITSFTYLGIMLSIPILKSTNDERGYSNNLIKHGFYIYYPLHLSILYVLHLLIIR